MSNVVTKCYRCNEEGHKSNVYLKQRAVNFSEVVDDDDEEEEEGVYENTLDEGKVICVDIGEILSCVVCRIMFVSKKVQHP